MRDRGQHGGPGGATDQGKELARLYDLDLLEDPGDLDLYVALARRTGGPILELGVGTGRVAVPLAEAGYEVTGVDIDPAMLARARDRASQARALDRLEPALKETALLVLAEDMSHAQAGEVLGVAESTVSWRMYEVKKRLKTIARIGDE